MVTLEPLFKDEGMRFIFVGGKGGVGKTTSASAMAVQLAKQRAPTKVLLISTDPAHNLSDAFQQKFADTPTLVEGTTNLFAMETDPSKVMDAEVESTTKGVNDKLVVDFKKWVASVPGIDEAIALSTVLNHVDSGAYGTIIFDTAPTGHTLRLLQLPGVLKVGIDKLTSWKAKLGGLLSSVAGLVAGESDEDVAKRTAMQTLEVKLQTYRAAAVRIGDIFRDHKRTTFVCVCIAEHLSVFETLRLIAELQQANISSRYILVNQLVPQRLATLSDATSGANAIAKALTAVGLDTQVASAVKEACELCGARARLQAHYLHKLEGKVADSHEVVLLPLLKSEVRGLSALLSFSGNMIVPAPLKAKVEGGDLASVLAATDFEAVAQFGAGLRLRMDEEVTVSFEVGDTVEIFGLKAAAKYNGKRGLVKGYDASEGRYSVALVAPSDDAVPAKKKKRNKTLNIKANNLHLIDESDTEACAAAAPAVAPAVAALDPALKQELMGLIMSGGLQGLLAKPEIKALRDDPDTKQFFVDLNTGGLFGAMKYLGNETVMNKLLEAYARTK